MNNSSAYFGDGRIDVLQRPADALTPGAVRIRVEYVGLCGTDLHILKGHMDRRVSIPHIFGHEPSGYVEAMGEKVQGLNVGDLVTVMPLVPCDNCPTCWRGDRHVCTNLQFVGIDTPGALQQHWDVPAETVVRVPESISARDSALIEPLAVAVHDVRRSGIGPGDRALVFGGGPIGQLIGLVLRELGVKATLVEPSASRRQRAANVGLRAIAATPGDIEAAVAAETDSDGYDVVFEASGAAGAAESMTNAVRVRGTIVIVGVHAVPRSVDLHRIFWKELHLVGARVYQSVDYRGAIALLLKGSIPTEQIISGVVGLDHVAEAMADLATGDGMKILVNVSGSESR